MSIKCAGLFLSTFFLFACGSSSTMQTVLPNGKTGFVITCTDSSDCVLQAGKACPIGYTIVSEETKKVMEVNPIAQYNYGSCVGQKQVNSKAECDDTPPTPVEVERTTKLISCGASAPATEKTETKQVAQEPAPSPSEDISCTAFTAKQKQFAIHFASGKSANTSGDGERLPDCTFLPNDEIMSVPDEKASDGQFSYGSMFPSCMAGLEKIEENGCLLSKIWSCTDNQKGETWGFAMKIRENPSTHKVTGQFMVDVGTSSTCERVYIVSNP